MLCIARETSVHRRAPGHHCMCAAPIGAYQQNNCIDWNNTSYFILCHITCGEIHCQQSVTHSSHFTEQLTMSTNSCGNRCTCLSNCLPHFQNYINHCLRRTRLRAFISSSGLAFELAFKVVSVFHWFISKFRVLYEKIQHYISFSLTPK